MVAVAINKCEAPSAILPLYDSGECSYVAGPKLDAGRMWVGGYRTTFPSPVFKSSAVHVNAWPWEPGMDFRESLNFIKDSPLSAHPHQP